MPALSSTTEFIDLLRQSGIYQAAVFDEVMTKVPDLPDDPSRAAVVCVQRGVLTRFQAKLLLNGRSKGFRLGPYVILDQLGQGGMGTVFLAEHSTLHRQVALKVLNPPKDVRESQVAIERFLREARAAAALDHPNIVRLHDVSQQGSVHYIALEYVDGVTLEQLLQKGGPITPSRAVGYIAQAAAGLQHADERGFVHRDIKPSNLILTKDQKTLKILDMGLARSFTAEEDKLTERLDHGAVTGTVDFISPEQSMGSTDLDIRADIYSLGATFFTLIAGKPPFAGNTTQKLAQHQMKPAPNLTELDPTLPKDLATVVSKMLAKKPKDRYQTPNDVIAALGPWLGNSRTNLGNSAAMSETVMSGGGLSNALTERQDPPATEHIAPPSEAEQNTLSGGAANTARRTTKRRKKAKQAEPQKKRMLMIGGGVLGVLLVGIVVGVFAFGGSKKPDQALNNPPANNIPANNPPANNPSKVNPNPSKVNPNSSVKTLPNHPAGDLLYHVDFRDLQTASRSVTVGEKVFAHQIGSQSLPLGWAVNHHEPTTGADYLIDDVSGAKAVGIKHVRGGRTEILCRIDTVLNTPQRVGENRTYRIEYQLEGTGIAQVGVKLEKEPYTKHVLETLTPTNGKWQQVEFAFTRQTADPIVIICTLTPDPTQTVGPVGTLWIRSMDVWTTRAAAAPVKPDASAAAPSATSTASKFTAWKAGSVVYKTDFSTIEPFQVTKEGTKVRTGTPEHLPKGIRASCWKQDATAEFRCESVDGSQALGLVNLNSEKSGQIAFELEREMNLRLAPGKAYRVAVEYMTKDNAAGTLMVQKTEASFKSALNIPLASTDGQWKTATSEFERKDGEPIRLALENTSVGEGNVVYIRSIEVTELVKPNG